MTRICWLPHYDDDHLDSAGYGTFCQPWVELGPDGTDWSCRRCSL